MLPCRVCMGHRSAGKSMPTYPPTLSRFGSGCPVGYAWEAGERGRGTPGRLTAQYTTPPPPPPDLSAVCHTPYNIGNGSIMGKPRHTPESSLALRPRVDPRYGWGAGQRGRASRRIYRGDFGDLGSRTISALGSSQVKGKS